MKLKIFYIWTLVAFIGIIYWNFSMTNNKKSMEISQIETLKYLVQEPENGINSDTKTLILLHGVGSNKEDLFALRKHLPKNLLIISTEAPIKMGENRYGWYLVDFSTGKPVYKPEEAQKSQQIILNFIDEIVEKYGVKNDNLYLLGFSQGAIMSLGIALTNPNKIAGILALSGRVLKEDKANKVSNNAMEHLKIMIAHGTVDNVLPIRHARESKVLFETMPSKLIYKEYNMGHQISEEELKDILNFLTRE